MPNTGTNKPKVGNLRRTPMQLEAEMVMVEQRRLRLDYYNRAVRRATTKAERSDLSRFRARAANDLRRAQRQDDEP